MAYSTIPQSVIDDIIARTDLFALVFYGGFTQRPDTWLSDAIH